MGLSHLHQQVFETDSDDEDFDDNSAANQESEVRFSDESLQELERLQDHFIYYKTSEEMKELVPESDMEVEGASDHEEINPSVWVGEKNDGIEATENGGIMCVFTFVCLKNGSG